MRTWFLRGVSRWLCNRAGGVVVAYAILAPILIATTGIAVDIGYWYQQQTNLQSAADAAAMSVAQGSVAHVVVNSTTNSTYVGSSGPGPSIAVAAANNATNSKYGFAATGNATVAVSGTYTYNAANSTGAASYTANVIAPRRDFFSHISANVLGLRGLVSGTQSASATVQVNETLVTSGGGSTPGGCTAGTACYCASFGNVVVATGNSRITGTNCGIYAGGSITTSGSSQITGTNVATGQTAIGGLGNGYIGTGTPVLGTTSGVSYSASAPTDYLAGLIPPTWPTMPAGITSTSYTYTTAPSTNPLTLAAGNWQGLWGLNNSANTFNYGTTSGTSNIYGGVGGSGGTGTVFNGSTYNITGSSGNKGSNYGIAFSSCWGGYAINLNGTYYNVQSDGTTYATYLGCPTATIGNSPTSGQWEQFYLNGGLLYANSVASVNHASGLYEITAYNSSGTYCTSSSCAGGTSCSGTSCSKGAFVMTNGSSANIYLGTCSTSSYTPPITCSTIWPNTYFINGGLNLSGGINTVYFMPGVYYVENGYLNIGSGVKVVGTNVTFILENGAGFILGGASTFNISAPTTSTDPNCVTIGEYPKSSYTGTNMPYDGTNGHGICDVAIYQVSSDSAADYLIEGASNVINGAVYAPSSALTISGDGQMTVTSNGYASVTAKSLNVSGSGALTMTEHGPDTGSTGGSGSGGSTTTISYAAYLLTS